MNKPTIDAFISYAKEDRDAALRLREDLTNAGIRTWLDVEDLLPGQNWRHEIETAIRASRTFIALLSHRAVNKRGFVQKELRDAIELLDQLPESMPFIIPARLDDCEPSHERLADIHWVDLFDSWDTSVAKIIETIRPSQQTDSSTHNPQFLTYIIVDRPHETFAQILDQLSSIDGVKDVFTLLGGEYDIMVTFSETGSLEVFEIVMNGIRMIPGVRRVSTMYATAHSKHGA